MSENHIISILFGGVMGAYIVSRFTIWRFKEQLTQEVIDRAIDNMELIDQALYILHFEVDVDGFIPKGANHENKFKKVIKAGDFLEYVARLYLTSRISIAIIECTNIPNLVNRFISLLIKSGFMSSDYDLRAETPSKVHIPKPWRENWVYLSKLEQHEKPSLWQRLKALWF